jgi:hypothetical protein
MSTCLRTGSTPRVFDEVDASTFGVFLREFAFGRAIAAEAVPFTRGANDYARTPSGEISSR